MLLEAFRLSELAEQRVKIALIGDGPAMEDLRRYAAEHRMDQSVVFTGPLPHAAVPPYLDLIDIAVQPAANEYCCPMKILEYMALAKPVIAPAQENIQELLTENEALFFKPGDAASLAGALRRMASDPGKASAMGRAARAAVVERGYLWTENARRVVERFAAPGRTQPFPARQAKAS
jgi:glycosyltransferase involved in cell wall biosynthesis